MKKIFIFLALMVSTVCFAQEPESCDSVRDCGFEAYCSLHTCYSAICLNGSLPIVAKRIEADVVIGVRMTGGEVVAILPKRELVVLNCGNGISDRLLSDIDSEARLGQASVASEVSAAASRLRARH